MTSATLCGYTCMNCPGMCVHVCVQLYSVIQKSHKSVIASELNIHKYGFLKTKKTFQ